MPSVSLKIHIVKTNNTKTFKFDAKKSVYDATELIREKVPDARQGQATEYGLFLPDDDPTKGRWLEQGRTLEYYHLTDGNTLEYKTKQRVLRFKTVDGSSILTVLIDDSASVEEITNTVCAKIDLRNPEEFSLLLDSEAQDGFKKGQATLTRQQKELEKLKKKLHTDDELNWLRKDLTLREQGIIDETQVLTLRKRLFFHDQNVDVNDPVQLNLLYVQCRDCIINGSYPCTKDEAVQFAAYQCQVQYGRHNPSRHKPGFLSLSELLPQEYIKVKGIEKVIFHEHNKLGTMTDLQAKFRYIQDCRNLRTYGVTFFLVKEKVRGKSKLVPRLLGIARDSIMRVDETTKEIIKSWPLFTVRRWAASHNSFTIDFGDYSEAFYSVQTMEGDKISRLISSYIKLILETMPQAPVMIPRDDQEPVMEETENLPQMANTMVMHPSTMGQGAVEDLAHQGVLSQSPQLGDSVDLGLATIRTLMASLQSPASPLRAGIPPDVCRQTVHAAMAAILASAASIITQTTTGEAKDIDYIAVGTSVSVISSNLMEMSQAVRILASLSQSESEGNNLLDAASALAAACADLMGAARPENLQNRQEILDTAGEMGTKGGQLLLLVGDLDMDAKAQATLVQMAKHVASTTSALVGNAREVSRACEDPSIRGQVDDAVEKTVWATQALIACTKVLAPCIDTPLCQDQLTQGCKVVSAAVRKLVLATQAACMDDASLQDLGAAAAAVTDALRAMLEQLKLQSTSNAEATEEVFAAILAAADDLLNSMGDHAEMLRKTKLLAETTASVIGLLKMEADDEMDPAARQLLLDAARALADATSHMVEAAKMAAQNPGDKTAEEQLQLATENLKAVTLAASSAVLKKKAIGRLETAAKDACAVSTQFIAASRWAGNSNTDEASQRQLIDLCKAVGEHISSLVQAVRNSVTNHSNPAAQLELINESLAMIPPAGKMVAGAKEVVPYVDDQLAALQLGNSAKATATALGLLRNAALRAQEVCGPLEIDCAIHTIQQVKQELEVAKDEARAGKLPQPIHQSLHNSVTELNAASKAVGSSMAQLVTAANQGNESFTGIAAKDTAKTLGVVATAVKGVASFSKDPRIQEHIIATAQQLMDESVALVSEARQAIQDPNASDKQLRLARAAKAASQALNQVVSCIPGLIEMDQSLKDMEEANLILQSGKFPNAAGQSYQALQTNLSEAASSLNLASSKVVTSVKREPDEQAASASSFVGCYKELLTAGLMLAGVAKEQQNQQAMVEQISRVSEKSNGLLFAARIAAKDPDTMNDLIEAARNLADSLNALLGLSAAQGPGLKECEDALRKIEAVAAQLDNPNHAISALSYFDCIDVVVEKSLVLGDSGNQIKTASRNGDFDQFGVAVESTSLAVCQLTEATVQAAYLVGVSDAGSEAGVQGLVDQAQFVQVQQAITLACQNLLSPTSTQEQVLSSATAIAQNTSVLCSSCKLAASKTSDEDIRGNFMEAAKDVASATSNLVKNIRVLAGDVSDENREACAESSRPLLKAVDDLVTFASSSLFASSPAKFSAQAREAQEPILQAGKNVIKSSSSLLASAKNLAIDPNDMSLGQLLAQHSKAVSDSVRALLLAIRTKCPGQKDCDQAIDALNDTVNQLDQAILAVLSQSLRPIASSSLQGFQEQMMECVGKIGDNLGPLSNVAKGEMKNLGHQVATVADLFQSLAAAAIGEASHTTSSHMQTSLLEYSKALAENGLQLMYAVKEAGGNPRREEAHAKVDKGVQMVTTAISDLVSLLEKVESEAGFIAGMVDMITNAQSQLAADLELEAEESFAEYQSSTISQSKALVKCTQEMVSKSKSSPKEMFAKAKNVTATYCKLVETTRYCLATIESDQVAEELLESVHGTGDVCISLVKAGSAVSGSPDDQSLKRALMDQARIVAEKVGQILSAVQSAAVGTQACNEAVATIKGIMGDIETTAMFARAGALNPESEGSSFAEHRESILETAKKLAEFPKILLSNVAEGQEQLKTAAALAVRIMASEAENVKLGAASLTSDDTAAQILLLTAVKDVANSLAELMNAARITSGKNSGDETWEGLKNCAKGMVTKVSALLKTVKSVEDEAGRGVRLLESTIDRIDAEIKDYDSDSPPKIEASVEDMVQATKDIALASSKTVSAGNSCRQVEVSAAANLSATAVEQLLHACKSVAVASPTTESHDKVMSVGRDCAIAFKTLLELVHQIVLKPSSDLKKKLPAFSKEVASTVAEIIQVAGQLKEGAGFFDPSDPRARAEQELLAAAASIEAAAKKLSGLKPRRNVDADESLTFDEQILEAAKSIAAATKDLVQYARVAQAELVRQGRVSGKSQSSEDSQWSEGLVSAAKLVAMATSNLCEAANQVVQGEADEHKLITAAKAVSSHTTQLLIACNVKADANSESNRRLKIAGDAVKKATDALVKAAESAIANSKDDVIFGGKDVTILTGAQKHMMDELQLQEKIARARREIDKLEEQLSQVQKGVTKDMTAMAGGVGRRRFMVELEIKDLLAKKYKNLNTLEADLARLRKEVYQ